MSGRLERAQHLSECHLGQAPFTRAAFPTNVPAFTLEGFVCEEQPGEIFWESSASRLLPGGQRT